MTPAEIDRRLRILLPPEYEDDYEQVQPVSMGSAGLRYGPDGRVAWDKIWGSFCDLAMAGGPPHRGKLLEPGTRSQINTEPERYQEVVAEICRGIRLLTGRTAEPARIPGWVRLSCRNEAMAGWMARAIAVENISVFVQGSVLCLPASPSFRIEKEIKNVLTSVAKTDHYWTAHASLSRHREIARLLLEMDREAPLVQPPLQLREKSAIRERAAAKAIAVAIESASGMRSSSDIYPGWIAIDCVSIASAVRIMRALIPHNLLARREETLVFAPHNSLLDPEGAILIAALAAILNFSTAHLAKQPAIDHGYKAG